MDRKLYRNTTNQEMFLHIDEKDLIHECCKCKHVFKNDEYKKIKKNNIETILVCPKCEHDETYMLILK